MLVQQYENVFKFIFFSKEAIKVFVRSEKYPEAIVTIKCYLKIYFCEAEGFM